MEKKRWMIWPILLALLCLSMPSFSAFAEEPVPRGFIRYDANGGRSEVFGNVFDQHIAGTHLRENTLQGAGYFWRDGYVLTGWNTMPDGSGTHIGLGSRTAVFDGSTLYAEWAQATDRESFLFSDGTITAYSGKETVVVIPESIEGIPVKAIAAGAFANCSLDALVLPSSLETIEPNAFSACSIRALTLFDRIRTVSDDSFSDCTIHTLFMNAARLPVYSGSYFDTFSDKYDYLLSLGDAPKLVLFSGSSARYGYDSAAIEAAFPDYRVVNMGVYAYSNALPQYEAIRPLLNERDILLISPEFDAVREQFCVTDALDTGFWAMAESNYDLVSNLELTRFSGVFDSFASYQKTRSGMALRNYAESPAAYDDDGNRYNFATYNAYGDFILPRPNSERDELHRHNIADYTVETVTPEAIASLNRTLKPFTDAGIAVFFTYAPRNRSSLTERSTPAARAALEQELHEQLEIPIISSLAESLYSGIYFWNIDNHLSTEGVQLRTSAVIRDLKAQMVLEGLLPPEASPGPVIPFAWWRILIGTGYGLAALLVLLGRLVKRWSLLQHLAGVVWAATTVFALVVRATPSVLLLTALCMLLLLTVGKRGERA